MAKGGGSSFMGYLKIFGIALAAVFVANNVDAVSKIVAKKPTA